MAKNRPPIYIISVLLFMLVLPVISVLIACENSGQRLNWPMIGKWFVFWAIGARLFIAGLRQVTKPAFTAKEIFKISGTDSFIVIRELGFANISIGLLGMLSIFDIKWCQAAAIGGGLYFGLAGILHILKEPDSKNELIALISDLYIFVIAVLYLVFTMLLPAIA